MNSCALAASAAACTSARDARGRPYAMLSATVALNSAGSCDTSATASVHACRLHACTSMPPMVIVPTSGL